MMRIVRLFCPVAAMAALLWCGGCISVQKTRVEDAERRAVTFASDRAASVFYETLHVHGDKPPQTETQASVFLLFVSVDKKVIDGPNRRFNEAVQVCDTNRDGLITEREANVFAQEWSRVVGRG